MLGTPTTRMKKVPTGAVMVTNRRRLSLGSTLGAITTPPTPSV
jgi:hypothetical protein